MHEIWVWEDPLEREWLPTPVFLPGEFHGQRSLAGSIKSMKSQRVTNTTTAVATCSGKQTHPEGHCRRWGAVYYTGGPTAESPFSQGAQWTFVNTLNTWSVLLKPTSPNSLNLAWKVLNGDTVRLQSWFIIRRVSWLYIVAYTNGCHKEYRGSWLHRGLLHSFWRWEILVWIWCLSVGRPGRP